MSTLKVATIQDTSGNNSSTPNEVAQGRAKAWLNLTGTGTIAIADSFNISSVTDIATGAYSAAFTNAMSNANYSAVASPRYPGFGAFQIAICTGINTGSVNFNTQDLDNNAHDAHLHLAVFGD